MTQPAPAPPAFHPARWLNNQPYLLLSLTSLFWAGTISLLGVLTIILRGDFGALAGISFNRGDLMFASSLVSFGLYSALIPRRPVTHALSLISFTTCCGALMLVPFSIWEYSTGVTLKF